MGSNKKKKEQIKLMKKKSIKKQKYEKHQAGRDERIKHMNRPFKEEPMVVDPKVTEEVDKKIKKIFRGMRR